MPVTSVTKDLEALTITVVADFPVPLTRLWNAYADPRQLERFWGPPTFPAIFTRHDMFPGGRSHYCMTGPENEVSCGYWEHLSVKPMESFEVLDGFADSHGTPNADLPSMRLKFDFTETLSGSRVTSTTYFNSLNELQSLIEMGMEEGMHAAMGQMDAALANIERFSADAATWAQILSDTQVRVSRVVRGTVEQVWMAHHDAALMQRWLLGPDGWTMPVCEIAREVGDTYRYEWAKGDGGDRFGFTGELCESLPPHRAVTTESMIGMEGPGTVNEMTLTQVDGGTLVSILISYPNAQVREAILATGMVTGMEASYARLESEVLASM